MGFQTMATITAIEPENGYLHVRFSGEAARIRNGFESALASHRTLLLAACEKYDCRKVLLDLTAVSRSIGLTEEHLAATVMVKYWPPGLRIAFVPSQSYFADSGRHMERVARNRGAALQIFEDAETAKAWLTADQRPSALSA